MIKKQPDKKRILLEVDDKALVFIVHTDGTREMYCPDNSDKIPKCQMRGIIESIQDMMEAVKGDVCMSCDCDIILPPKNVT